MAPAWAPISPDCAPLAGSQKRMSPPSLPEASILPSGETATTALPGAMATTRAGPTRPAKVRVGWPVLKPERRKDLSAPAEATRLPSGEGARIVTAPPRGAKERVAAGGRGQNLRVPSAPAL